MSDTMSRPETGYRIQLVPETDGPTCREPVRCDTPLDGGECPNKAEHITLPKEWSVLPVPQYVVPLLREARDLIDRDGERNVEYERALVEVIARLLPADMDTAREIAESLLWAPEGSWIT
jgi:hypothetical protein